MSRLYSFSSSSGLGVFSKCGSYAGLTQVAIFAPIMELLPRCAHALDYDIFLTQKATSELQ